jgi:formylglycine-generating enzyme required for sulfatase activity
VWAAAVTPPPPEAPEDERAGEDEALTPVDEEAPEPAAPPDEEEQRISVTPPLPSEKPPPPPAVTPREDKVPSPPGWPRKLLRVLAVVVVLVAVGSVWLRPPTVVVADLRKTIAAGEVKKIDLHVHRNFCTGPIHVTFPGLPDGLDIKEVTIEPGHESAEVEVCAYPDAEGEKTITVVAWTDYRPAHTEQVTVTIGPLPYRFLPKERRWEPAKGAKPVRDGDRYYYDRIIVTAGDIQVPFILIRRGEWDDDLGGLKPIPSFYIMEDKVWLGLFKEFAKTADPLRQNKWQTFPAGWKGHDVEHEDDYPVMGVTWPDAVFFARWLGGEVGAIPRPSQWDKGAGQFWKGRTRGAGPYDRAFIGVEKNFDGIDDDKNLAAFFGDMKQAGIVKDAMLAKQTEGRVGICRRKQGPMKRGEAKLDVSPCKVLNMAGNGCELTSTAITRPEPNDARDVLDPRQWRGDSIELRGARWDAIHPHKYYDKKPDKSQPAGVEAETTGFRVVLDLEN